VKNPGNFRALDDLTRAMPYITVPYERAGKR
jgi:hypothetical protein